jgi:hypothetical protein
MNFSLITALWKGRALINKEAWASFGSVTTVIFSLLTAVFALFPDVGITPDALHSIAVTIAHIGSITFGYEEFGPDSYQWVLGFIGVAFTFVWSKYFKTVTNVQAGFGKLPSDSSN